MRRADAVSILSGKGWLAGEPKWLHDAILKSATLRTYRPGAYTHFAGDTSGDMFGIVQGSFGVLIPVASGELVLCHVLPPGTWFGLGPILTDGPRSLSYRALEKSHVLHVPLADLRAIAERHPEFYRRIGILTEASYYATAIRVLGDLLVRSGEHRIAAVLTRLASAGSREPGQPSAPIRLSQADIGQISNTSRDRVNRALQKFARAGWITLDYKAIVVLDRPALEAFVQQERG